MPSGDQIKISMATGGAPYGPAKEVYKVGERIPLVITVTNTGSQPVSVCDADTLYQDRPQLVKDGKTIPYATYRQSMVLFTERNRVCDEINLPQQILLKPNEPQVIDFFVLVTGAKALIGDGWYGPLQPGKYTLFNKRRLSCCDGLLVDTNTLHFEVVP
ncbi:MAG TPA: hypothetical protein VGC95_00790 [Chitinophagaceae bacterium]